MDAILLVVWEVVRMYTCRSTGCVVYDTSSATLCSHESLVLQLGHPCSGSLLRKVVLVVFIAHESVGENGSEQAAADLIQ